MPSPLAPPNGLSSLRGPALLYALIAAIALVAAFLVFPPEFLAARSRMFESGDAVQHLSGWQFYRDDPWRFPLLLTTRLNAPEGVSIAFTDSIPLLALLFKPIAHWLPADFQYFGLWHVLVLLAQALGGVFLVRSLGARQWYAAFGAAAFAVLMPAFGWRLGHSSLMAHGFVLFALGFYFRGIGRVGLDAGGAGLDAGGAGHDAGGAWASGRAAAALGATALLGLLVHPYWLAMCGGLFVAFLIDDARQGNGWRPQLQRFALFLAILAVLIVVLGYTGSSGSAEGFGYFSMNLTAPFCGGRYFDCWVNPTGGQYEGFNYLGMGLWLVLLPLALWLRWRERAGLASGSAAHGNRPRSWANQHAALLVYAVICTLYAVSNKVYFGETLVLDIPLPAALEWLTNVFRASGRFFWPVGYLILFTSLAAVMKRLRPAHAIPVLAIAVTLQTWEIPRKVLHQRMSEPGREAIAHWTPVLAGLTQINLYPAFGCTDARSADQYLHFQRLAGYFGLLMDTGYIARSKLDCDQKSAKFRKSFAPGHLYVMVQPWYSRKPLEVPQGFRQALAEGACAIWHRALVCRSDFKPADWRAMPMTMVPASRYLDGGRVLQWPAAELPTNIGRVVDGQLVPKNPRAVGYLSFGPYTSLPPGRYVARLEYRSSLSPAQTAGGWDAVAADLDGGRSRAYWAEPLRGTFGELAAVERVLEINPGDGPLEVRTEYPGRGDLRIHRLLIALPETVQPTGRSDD